MGEMIIPTEYRLEFEESTHTYRFDGQRIPCVSDIMKPLSEAKYNGISKAVLNKAAERGTIVHNAIENWIKYGIEDIPPEYSGYFKGFIEYLETYNPKILSSEIRTYHKAMRYAGTIDLLAEENNEIVLIDFKTTSTVSDMTCGVQLEAYSQALKSQGVEIQCKKILHLKNNAKYEIRNYPVKDTKRWQVFGSLKIIYDYIHQD